MSTKKLSNIPVKEFRKFLENQGLNIIKDSKGRGGHENLLKTQTKKSVKNLYITLIINRLLRRASSQ